MSSNRTTESIEHLVFVNREAETDLSAAARTIDNSELETIFSQYSDRHAKFAAELEQEMSRLGAHPRNSEGPGASLRQGWKKLAAAISGDSPSALLAVCESSEESVESAYLDAMDTGCIGKTAALLEKHLQQVKEFRKRLGRLMGETKAGLEFQKNE